MMKFLVLVFGTIAMECANAKFWHGNDRPDETFRIFVWIAYLKRLSLIAFMLLSVLLYYVPESRTHARRICFYLIDSIADGLKLLISATEYENQREKYLEGSCSEYVDKLAENDGKRRSREKTKIVRDEARRQESRRTSSRYRSQEGKYQNHRRDHRQRYRETCVELAPVIRNRYRTCALVALNNAYPSRLEKKYDTIIDKTNHRKGIFYSKNEGVIGYEDDFAPIDSGISTNFYDSPSNRRDLNVADAATYRREIVGDNEYLADTNEGRSTIRQMQGDTIPEIPCNENSYTSLEAEADDENSQGDENGTLQTNFSKETEVETKENFANSTIHDVPMTTKRQNRKPDVSTCRLFRSSGNKLRASHKMDLRGMSWNLSTAIIDSKREAGEADRRKGRDSRESHRCHRRVALHVARIAKLTARRSVIRRFSLPTIMDYAGKCSWD